MTEYEDDRRGMMRVHISARRAALACDRYTRNNLRTFAADHGLKLGGLRKTDIAWFMADHGLIDADGYLRDGFPDANLPDELRARIEAAAKEVR